MASRLLTDLRKMKISWKQATSYSINVLVYIDDDIHGTGARICGHHTRISNCRFDMLYL